MNNERKSINKNKRKFADLPTEEILAIVEKHDRAQWSEEDLAAASELLKDRRRGVAVAPLTDMQTSHTPAASVVPPSVTVLRVCAFLYFVVSGLTCLVILKNHQSPDVSVAPFIMLTLFQGVVVGTVLLVIALIGEKASIIAAILSGDR